MDNPEIIFRRMGADEDRPLFNCGSQDLNKTGCRFIIVDAANNERTLKFYERNGFQFLDIRPEAAEDRTRLMYFDLLTFRE